MQSTDVCQNAILSIRCCSQPRCRPPQNFLDRALEGSFRELVPEHMRRHCLGEVIYVSAIT